MTMKAFLKLALAGSVLLAGAAQATVVVDRSPDTVGFNTDFNAVNQIGGQNFFSRFTLGAGATLTGMDIYSTFSGAAVGTSVVVRFRADAGGPAATNLVSLTTTISAIDLVGSSSLATLQRLHADFAGVTLDAGTYWASLAGVTEIGQSIDYSMPAATRQFFGEAEQVDIGVFAPFRLSDDAPVSGVPEMGTWALMLAGFGMTGAAMRRRVGLTA